MLWIDVRMDGPFWQSEVSQFCIYIDDRKHFVRERFG